MTQVDQPTQPEGRPGRWRLFAPSALLLLCAAGWSGFWFFAASKAEEAVDVWLAREASRGRVYACGERSVGGYPFRIEIDCRRVTARVPAAGGEATAIAPRFVALAQVYDPKRLIGELHGPVEFTAPDGARAELSFSLAQASARIVERRFERGSLALATPRLVADGEEIGAAKSFEAHLRRTPDGERGAWDLAATLEGGDSPALGALPIGAGPLAATFRAEARGVPDLEPGPMAERLRAFAGAGGRLTVRSARLARGDVVAEARGELALDREGRANGAIDVATRGVEDLVKSLAGGGADDGLSALLGLGAAMLGKKSELDGKAAVTYRIGLDKGRVSLGPVRLARLPPAF